MRRSPRASLIAHNLGRYYFYAGDVQNAQKWEARALELWQISFVKNKIGLMNIYLGLGGVSYKQGNFTEARNYFARGYELAPENEAVLQNLGAVSLALRKYDEGLQYYMAAIKVNPNNEISYSNLAAVYLSSGQFDLAITNAQKALEIYPQFSDACFNLARAYGAKGMKREAFAVYQRAKAMDPSRAGLADAEMQALAARK
jgi:tetratricopeptide (TPR) repeat protein